MDMVLDVSGSTPTITVEKSADDAVVSGVTAYLQQSALGQQIASLGGDPAQVASQLSTAKPQVTALHAPQRDSAEFGSRYAILMTIDVLLLFAIMGGGQFIAQGVVEEKSSRIVEILLACVRPSSLLAGKILGIGIASVLTTGAVAVAGVVAAKATGVMPDISLNLDGVLVAMIVWMIVGYAIFAVAFGAAASLVSRQDGRSSVSMPLVMLSMVPYVLSFLMATGDTNSMTFRVLSYVPPFAPFMMPARLVPGGLLLDRAADRPGARAGLPAAAGTRGGGDLHQGRHPHRCPRAPQGGPQEGRAGLSGVSSARAGHVRRRWCAFLLRRRTTVVSCRASGALREGLRVSRPVRGTRWRSLGPRTRRCPSRGRG